MKSSSIDWDKLSKDYIDDGKFNQKFPVSPYRPDTMVPFPGYIENKQHPFTELYLAAKDKDGNITDKFAGSDSYNTFKKNLKTQPSDWKYRTKEVTYNKNSSGYRTYEWDQIDWKNSIVLFGCSCTYGIGLAEDETIATHIEKLTGKQVVNLGFPGGSNKLIIDNSASLIKNFEMPYAVVINWTTTDRTRFYHEKGYHDIGPWDSFIKKDKIPVNSKFPIVGSKYWSNIFYNPSNELAMNYYWSTYADAIFLNRTNYIKLSLFESSAHATRSDTFIKMDNDSRDLVHPGEQTSIKVAEYVANKLNEMDNT